MTPTPGAPEGMTQAGPAGSLAGGTAPFGLPQGMQVLTLDGALPVEHLVSGDRIVTRRDGSARLTGHVMERVRTHAVEVRGGALGNMDPDDVLVLPAGQMILLRDWRARIMFGQPQATIAVGALVDHGFIRDLGEVELTLHRLIFERAEVIYAQGLELLSAAPRRAMRPAA